MLRRRLHLQIYFAIVVSLVLTMVLTGLLWNLFGRDRLFEDIYEATGRLVMLSLPPAAAPADRQAAAIRRMGRALDMDLALFDSAGRSIASFGETVAPPPRLRRSPGNWRRFGRDHHWMLALPDGRQLVGDFERHGRRRPLLGLLAFLGSILVAATLAAYPLVRRLTRRLERLQTGVERIGEGELSARVQIEGRDEIASLAQSFNVAAAKIEKLVNAHRLLLANASHELRTPLARIRLGIEMSHNKPDGERAAALRADIGELEMLIDEILLMSRLEMGASSVNRQDVDIVALAAEECARFDNCRMTGTSPEIVGDEQLLRRMIRNLLENARLHGEPPIRMHLSQQAGFAILEVGDKGSGIPPENAEKVFQPFFRAPGRQNIAGYGLGLPLVRQIAEAHGGSAEILDRSQHGSTIRVRLALS